MLRQKPKTTCETLSIFVKAGADVGFIDEDDKTCLNYVLNESILFCVKAFRFYDRKLGDII